MPSDANASTLAPSENPGGSPSTEPESAMSSRAHGASSSSSSSDADLRELEAGLDRLQSSATDRQPSAWKRITRSVVPPIVVVLLAIAAWQLYIVIANPRPDLSPGPVDVFLALQDAARSGRLLEAIATSLGRGLLGFLIAIAVGTPIGLLLAEVAWIRRAVGPIISGLQVLPSVAWVPAAIIWFGLTDATVYFVVLMGAIPSIVNGLVSGIQHVPPQLRRAGRVLGASGFSLARHVVLPAALPGYLAGLRQGWAFSWRSLMAAEIIAFGGTIGFGLGSMLQQGRDLADLASVLGTIIVILAIGVLLELALFAPIERGVLRRRGLAGAGA